MRCMFLFRDAQGRLPSARELRLRGFRISEAVAPEEDAERKDAQPLAAEPPASYGRHGPEPEEPRQ